MKTMKFIFILLLYVLPAFAVAQNQNDSYTRKKNDGIKFYENAYTKWKAGDKYDEELEKAKRCFRAANNHVPEKKKQELKNWLDKCDQFPPKTTPKKQTSVDMSTAKKWTISWDEENQCILLKSGSLIEKYTMVPVEGGNYAYGEEKEKKTIMNFSIGETEVTELLWNVVMNGVSSKSLMPKTKFTWAECNQFMDKLIEKTGVIFRLPEASEWEYAASGGNKTKGYVYAGAAGRDELYQVTYTDYKLHQVKGKRENELGLYDMTGNAYELTSTPHKHGVGYILKGGSYIQADKNSYINYKKLMITKEEHFYEDDKQDYIGFRIVKSYE